MSDFFKRLRALVRAVDVRISEHGYDELADDDLTAREVLGGVLKAVVIDKYPEYLKGPCILLLKKDRTGSPIHFVWGIPKSYDRPVVLVTAYRPDPGRWDKSFTRRM